MTTVILYDRNIASCHDIAINKERAGILMSTLRTKSQSIKTLPLPRVDISEDKSPGKRDLAPENVDCQLSTKEKVGEEAKKTRRTFLDKMEAIAYGVQARFEEKSGFSRRVTEATVDTARELGIPEAEIKRWVDSRLARLIRDTEKLREIKARLERLQESFLDEADNKRPPHRTRRS